MKILLFYTYNQGYLSSFFHELSVKLIQEGHEVVSFSWKASISERIIDGVKVIVKKKKGYFTNYYNVYSLIKNEKPDVILSNFSYANPALLFGKLFGVKKNMVWFHSLNNQMKPSKSKILIKKQFLRLADCVIGNSYFTKNELYEIYKIPPKKLEVIPFWTTIQNEEYKLVKTKFKKDKTILNIGCPGRLTAHKNQKIVIEALSRIKASTHQEFHLYFAGTGEEIQNLENLSKYLNIGDHVTFLKELSPQDMVAFYNEMDVIVLPSLDEAFGLVLIETIALGRPIVVSSIFGALNFMDKSQFNLSDFTFNPESVSDLENKLMPYFNKTNLPSSFFKELYNKTFDKEVIYKSIKNVLTVRT